MEILEAIKTRRSIRHYKADPVDEESIHTVLEAAHWAPSWGNTQCWRFIVVRDSSIKARVAETLTKVRFENDWLENAGVQAIKQAPVLIVICAELSKAGYHPDGTPATDKGDWFMFDIALAMENLTLAARSLGLGTVIIGNFDSKKAAEILEVPAGFTVATMTPLGFPAREGQISPRKELSESIYNNKFNQ
jgi:nitroreductase